MSSTRQDVDCMQHLTLRHERKYILMYSCFLQFGMESFVFNQMLQKSLSAFFVYFSNNCTFIKFSIFRTGENDWVIGEWRGMLEATSMQLGNKVKRHDFRHTISDESWILRNYQGSNDRYCLNINRKKSKHGRPLTSDFTSCGRGMRTCLTAWNTSTSRSTLSLSSM